MRDQFRRAQKNLTSQKMQPKNRLTPQSPLPTKLKASITNFRNNLMEKMTIISNSNTKINKMAVKIVHLQLKHHLFNK